MRAGLGNAAVRTAGRVAARADATPPQERGTPAPAGAPRKVCVVLHDVAPARWAGCQRVIDALERCARQAGVTLPLTLLVVPRMHGDAAVPEPYLRWLRDLHAAGHQLALHGLMHRDEGPPARSLHEHLLRRHYTASEGEFAALSHAEASRRLRDGLAWARELGLPMEGFVAPAWLMSPPALDAVAEAGFSHTCTLTQVIALPQRQALTAPSLVFSTRAAWRRRLSLIWNTRLARRSGNAPLLRLELHPADADYPAVLQCWSGLLQEALRDRVPVTLAEAAQGAAG